MGRDLKIILLRVLIAGALIILIVASYNNCSSYQNQTSQSSQGCSTAGYEPPSLMVNGQVITPSMADSIVITTAINVPVQFGLFSNGGMVTCSPTDGKSYWLLPDRTKINYNCVTQAISVPGLFIYTYHSSENINGSQCPRVESEIHARVQVN